MIDPQQRALPRVRLGGAGGRRLRSASAIPGTIGVYAGAQLRAPTSLNLLLEPAARRARSAACQIADRQRQGLSAPRASPTSSTCAARASPCRPPARRRWSPSTWPARACSTGECDMALAGGVVDRACRSAPATSTRRASIVSPDGHCRAFDAAAAGTVCGSGVGVVVLKRLDGRAGRRRHHPRGHPRLGDQQRRRGARSASPRRASTGQAAGDRDGPGRRRASTRRRSATSRRTAPARRWAIPIEIAALTQAFRAGDRRRGFCAIGSVKTNIGHLDARRRRRRPDQDRRWRWSTGRSRRACTSRRRTRRSTSRAARSTSTPSCADWPRGDGAAAGRRQLLRHRRHQRPRACSRRRPPPQPAGAVAPLAAPAALGAHPDGARRRDRPPGRLPRDSHPEADLADVAYTLQIGRRAFRAPPRPGLPATARRPLAALRGARPAARAGRRSPRRGRPPGGLPASRAWATSTRAWRAGSTTPSRCSARARPLRRAARCRSSGSTCATCCSPRRPADVDAARRGPDLRALLGRGRDGRSRAASSTETAIAQPALFAVEYALAPAHGWPGASGPRRCSATASASTSRPAWPACSRSTDALRAGRPARPADRRRCRPARCSPCRCPRRRWRGLLRSTGRSFAGRRQRPGSCRPRPVRPGGDRGTPPAADRRRGRLPAAARHPRLSLRNDRPGRSTRPPITPAASAYRERRSTPTWPT